MIQKKKRKVITVGGYEEEFQKEETKWRLQKYRKQTTKRNEQKLKIQKKNRQKWINISKKRCDYEKEI